MSEKINLDKSLETGVPWQDRQHRELFKRIGSLLDAIEHEEAASEVVSLVDFLDEYVAFHFHDEEQFMHKYAYPDALAHTEEHVRFIDDLSQIREELAGGVCVDKVESVKARLAQWLSEHIGRRDKELGAFLIKRTSSMSNVI